MKDKLTPKQELFVKHYLVTLNATKAALQAGYAKKRAKEIGYENLTKPHIKEIVRAERVKLIEKLDVDNEQVLQGVAAIAFFDLADFYNDDGTFKKLSEIPKAARKALAGIDVDELFEGVGKEKIFKGFCMKIRLADKLKALELLGKHLGLFDDRVEVRNKFPDKIEINVVEAKKCKPERVIQCHTETKQN